MVNYNKVRWYLGGLAPCKLLQDAARWRQVWTKLSRVSPKTAKIGPKGTSSKTLRRQKTRVSHLALEKVTFSRGLRSFLALRTPGPKNDITGLPFG